MTATNREVVEAFKLQADWCDKLGSVLYSTVLQAAVDDIEASGPVLNAVCDFREDPVTAALALRLLGGVHRLVLMGLAPELARHYPSVGGSPDLESVGGDFVDVVDHHRGYLRDALSVAPQTNEVGRSVYLLPGLLEGLGGDSMDVRLLEIGASGGLNLLLDRFRYDTGVWTWGAGTSPVTIRSEWSGPPPRHLGPVSVVDRRGCDVNPLAADSEENQLRLLSFVWPDQLDRLERTRGAFALAMAARPTVDGADAARWLEDNLLTDTPRRTATVLQHSVMRQYLPADSAARLADVIDEASSRASRVRPFIHVEFEPPPTDFEPDGKGMMLTVTRWPGGERHLLARGHPHGTWVEWTG